MTAFAVCGVAHYAGCMGAVKRRTVTLCTSAEGLERRVSRRTLACAAAVALARLRLFDAEDNATEAVAADIPPNLPSGALQFSRVLAAKDRWNELGAAVARNETLQEYEWESTRKYLRVFYSVTADIRSLARPWEPQFRTRADAIAIALQKDVKAMDKPAKDHDVDAFLSLHRKAANELADFFDVFADAAAGDMPAEL